MAANMSIQGTGGTPASHSNTATKGLSKNNQIPTNAEVLAGLKIGPFELSGKTVAITILPY